MTHNASVELTCPWGSAEVGRTRTCITQPPTLLFLFLWVHQYPFTLVQRCIFWLYQPGQWGDTLVPPREEASLGVCACPGCSVSSHSPKTCRQPAHVGCSPPVCCGQLGKPPAAPLDLRQKLVQAWGLSLYQFFFLRPSVRIQNHYIWFLIQYLLWSFIFRIQYFDLKFYFALKYPMLLLMFPFWWPWEILEVIFWSSLFFMLSLF